MRSQNENKFRRGQRPPLGGTLIFFALLLLPLCAFADTLSVSEWLIAERPIAWPAFADQTDLNVLLDADQLDFVNLHPRENDFAPGATLPRNLWMKNTGVGLWPHGTYQQPVRIGYAAIYVTSSHEQSVKIHAETPCAVAVFIDGKEKDRSTTGSLDITAKFKHGRSLLLVKTILLPDSTPRLYTQQPFDRLEFNFDLKPEQVGTISVTTDAAYTFERFEDFTLFDDVSSPTISRDGKYAAWIDSHYNAERKKENQLQIMDLATRDIVYSTPPLKGLGNVTFIPVNYEPTLVYTTSGDNGSTIWQLRSPYFEPQEIARGIKGLVKLGFGMGFSLVYFTADADADKSETDYYLLDDLEDRLSDWTRTRELFSLSANGGSITRLISAADSFAIDEFAPCMDDDRILFTRRVPKPGRPYYDTQFWLMNTQTGASKQVASMSVPFETRPLSFTWLPGGQEIAFVTAAHEIGNDAANYPSYSQTALYILNTESGKIRNLTAGSRYSIEEDDERGAVRFNKSDGRLWFRAVMDSRIQLMSIPYNQPGAKAEHHNFYVPVTTDFDIADNGRRIFVASGPSNPVALHLVDGKQHFTLSDPNKRLIGNADFAGYSPYNFVNSSGDTIDGALYFPAGYEVFSHNWPLVVYFYGGTSPRDLRFTYTYHWWTANGYFVYVINPRGCIGYGEKFAAQHTNDWGTLASQDIIEGTQKLLAATPYLDKNRVGAYGGSYGGFITMDLATKTNLFAALCSMSGLSNIGSYFGEGEWGFTYGDLALPGSYPWNRRDVFVDKSPIYHADQIHTPLLLMHGTGDVNVPKGESEQMFTALKLLGKNTALVRFKNEDHSFAKLSNRVAEREILREWFDKYLKNDPSGWNARWVR
ncbi:S9 family peptidase [candidate division KSB1 bacterium]|nr:MAG: S9 family peptidase [candidate division KSB1 bacterium]